jgi:hypothetical protein
MGRGQILYSGLVLDFHRVDRPSGGVFPRIVVVADGGVSILADVGGLTGERPDRALRFINAPFRQTCPVVLVRRWDSVTVGLHRLRQWKFEH